MAPTNQLINACQPRPIFRSQHHDGHPLADNQEEITRRVDILLSAVSELSNRCDARDMIKAGLRAEFTHGIIANSNECLDLDGAHPLYYILDSHSRKASFSMDLLDLLDKVSLPIQ